MTFTEDLLCPGEDFDEDGVDFPFITMEGENAILDCNGYKIFSTDQGEGIGVLLSHGASAINCHIGNVEHAIVIVGDGCSTVMNVATAFTDSDSIQVQGMGKTVLDSIVIESSDADGIEVETSGISSVIMSDITISGTGSNGICLNERAEGETTIDLYGDISIEKTGSTAIDIEAEVFDVRAFCSLTILGSSADGISFDEATSGTFKFKRGSTTTSCFNIDDDIEGTGRGGRGGFVKEKGAHVQCDSVDDAGKFVCDEICVIPQRSSTLGSVTACVA